MQIAVLGAGVVGRRLAAKLREVGHDVQIGTRTAREDATSYADAAAGAELILNATNGKASLEALDAAGAGNLAGKVLIDASNPLDFSRGMPPGLSVSNWDSLGEQIQRAHPDAKVVKALNTVNNEVMVEPSLVPGNHVLFVCGNDEAAKGQVVDLVGSFGWPAERVIDLGDITSSRGMEMFLPLWLRLVGALGTPHLNISVEHA
jgi:8-hydroxy-5-deazaflavin:NADPH oxidoreductase